MGLFSQTVEEIINHLKYYNDNFSDGTSIKRVVDLILSGEKIFIYGAGRSGMVGRMFAQRLMHLDLSAYFISETITPAFSSNDCIIIISGSGETLSPIAIAKGAKKIGGSIVVLTANQKSTIGMLADELLLIKGQTKDAKQESLAPFTSLFDITALVTLDSLARVIMDQINKTELDIHRTHATLE
ncbi:MAG: 6-phospho-3-hexuloisomerase [Candidatus Hodarchaeales archaeon]|jgi:3-hexulose-6-phosphate synthase/6-phospho-3-hexuloisomerase